ncbi:uncharacterized protein A1O9_03929 [Exophiala aquamarina CBS 119918]|uniref:Protein kinase domain-containing protein n=1 Tax=Exophiala aquamarina CBS 119918 TaxID=1182545 RepID=A0A072PU64_9EURO|nr:uncharacterized protein A1O9_03929 [Exophiala aquamarina CBS 119918]KEF59085.1 hypothetical protein A1O9_03929 [Exophiala aquamarina CBS 119918]
MPSFLDRVVEFSDGISYQLLQPLTTFRHCHDGTPAEGRIVYTCSRIDSSIACSDEYIMKIKAQVPGKESDPAADPEAVSSNTTRAELKALEIFRGTGSEHVPHLVHYKQATQGPDGPLPGGYLTFTVMTKMPGDSLHNLYYWGMPADEREVIVKEFLVALRSIYAMGIEPIDCALRNVLWEAGKRRCTIIDFELWRAAEKTFTDEVKELQRWGLARQPAAKDHWAAWNAQFR